MKTLFFILICFNGIYAQMPLSSPGPSPSPSRHTPRPDPNKENRDNFTYDKLWIMLGVGVAVIAICWYLCKCMCSKNFRRDEAEQPCSSCRHCGERTSRKCIDRGCGGHSMC